MSVYREVLRDKKLRNGEKRVRKTCWTNTISTLPRCLSQLPASRHRQGEVLVSSRRADNVAELVGSQGCVSFLRTRMNNYSPPPWSMFAGVACASALAAIVFLRGKRKCGSGSGSGAATGKFGETLDAEARVVIVSCDEVIAAGSGESGSYGLSGADDMLLYDAFRTRGIPFHVRSWSDALTSWSSYDIVLVRTAWDYSASEARAYAFTRFLARISTMNSNSNSSSSRRLVNDARVQTWNVHKGYLAQVTAAAPKVQAPLLEIACVPSVLIAAGSRGDLSDILAREGWAGGGVMLKPAVGGGSRACLAVRNISTLTAVGALGMAQSFLDSHTLGEVRNMSAEFDVARVAAAALVAAPHAAAAAIASRVALSPSTIVTAAVDAVATGSGDARAAAWAALASRAAAAPDTHTAAVTPCDMLVQPFLATVSEGEISVIVIDGRVSHAVQKIPARGSWKCQQEYGATARLLVPVPPLVADLALRIVEAARIAVESEMPSLTPPTSPGAAEAASRSPPTPLPPWAILVARVDLLRVTPEMLTVIFKTAAERGEATPDASRTPYLLLEAELLEPALFFKEAAAAGIDAAGYLVDALLRE